MTSLQFLLIIFSVSLSAFAQFVLKKGMSGPDVQAAIASGESVQIFQRIALSPFVVGGLFIYFLGAIVWLWVLSKTDLSQAYPFVGLGFILTMALSIFLLGETVSTLRVLGTFVIVIGVVMVSRS
ncbi:MAG: EamA family transporter [Rhodobacteraceae bacterium]|nr:EamA family transporter [Paracoccaceae bacterium]